MKKVMRLFIPVLILFASCNKEKSFEVATSNPGGGGNGGGGGGGNTTGYFIQCKIDGTLKTFNVGAVGVKSVTTTPIASTSYAIAGKANSNASDIETLSLDISLFSSSALAAGTYGIDNTSGDYGVVGQYILPGGTQAAMSTSGDTSDNPFTIVVTSISSTEIAGTFKGKLFVIDLNSQGPPPTNPPSKVITEGQFKVKFQ